MAKPDRSTTVSQIEPSVAAQPWEHSEFESADGTDSLAALLASPAAGRYDLFTVLAHEYGHLLGISHVDGLEDLMSATLTTGIRLLPRAGDYDVQPEGDLDVSALDAYFAELAPLLVSK